MGTRPLPLHCILLVAALTCSTEGITLHKTTPPETTPTPKAHISKTRKEDNLYYPVYCPDGQKYCECPAGNEICKFVLNVEEIQTFTSYKFQKEYEPFLFMVMPRVKTQGGMRTTAGDTYYVDSRGYVPSLPPYSPENKNRPPEYGECSFMGNVTTISEETFWRNNCSVPITVDGATFRMIIGVNGQIPGPTLIVSEGQTVQVQVVNKLTSEGISVHWHGMHQMGTPWMDGVGFVTQPPISPGTHFDYIFAANPPGTHWYHSHIGAQRTDGLYGGLVIKEKEPLLGDFEDIPKHHTISLLDWQLESSLNLFVRIHSTLGYFPGLGVGEVPRQENSLYLRTHSTDNIEVGPVPYWSGLMNGMGRHNENTFSRLSIFRVEWGISYRFRLIGAQSLYAYKFSIDQHKLHLIATDGHLIEREVVDFIIIHTGERYDFILQARQNKSSYWMRAETLEADALEKHMAEGILVYEGAEEPNPNSKYTNVISQERTCTRNRRCVAVNCPFRRFPPKTNTDCLHLDKLRARKRQKHGPPQILQSPDENLQFFNFGFEGQRSTSAINGMNFRFPSTPYQSYCRQYEADRGNGDILCRPDINYPVCVNVATIAKSETYVKNRTEYPSVNFILSSVGDFSARNNDFSHPIHLHGHNFYVVAVRHGVYDASGKLIANNPDVDCHDVSCRSPSWREGKSPSYLRFRNRVRARAVQKDTVIVPAGGYVIIAFEADNPGYWLMHCHIEAHQLEGMALIVQEYPSGQQWAPPHDINAIGNFTWTVDDYKNSIADAITCDSQD